MAAIQAIHGKFIMPGCSDPLVVRYADAPGSRAKKGAGGAGGVRAAYWFGGINFKALEAKEGSNMGFDEARRLYASLAPNMRTDTAGPLKL